MPAPLSEACFRHRRTGAQATSSRSPARVPPPSCGHRPEPNTKSCCPAQLSRNVNTQQTVSAADALALLDGKNTTFLDIRTEANFTASHIAGAVNIPKALVRQVGSRASG